jgi:transposase
MIDILTHMRQYFNYNHDKERHMSAKHKDAKAKSLDEEGTLNSAPEKVSDPNFRGSEFFDPRDAVQVKYEMLRRVLVENASVTHAAQQYGITRPTFYQAKANFEEAGVAGLVPKKRGPRGPRKVQGKILAFVDKRLVPGEPIRARQMAAIIRDKFDVDVHPRTIERAIRGKKTLK